MRKVVAVENMTLDGFVDSQQGLGFEWTSRAYSDDGDTFGNQHLRADVDTALYGRRTFLGSSTTTTTCCTPCAATC